MTMGACPQARRLARASRREVLRVGAAGVLGLSLAEMLALEQAGAATRDDRACIILWLSGGPSQLDTFDPKPDAPAEVRGPFKAIETNVSGIRICEPFPRLARHADKYAILRSVYHTLDDHARGMCWMLAGRLHDSIQYPTMGSVVARLKPPDAPVPPFVTVPRLNPIAGIPDVEHSQTAGDLGPSWNPVIPDGLPGQAGFGLKDLNLPPDVTRERLARRTHLLECANRAAGPDAEHSPRAGVASVYGRAFELIHSDLVRKAFDLQQEPARVRESYGTHPFGQAALLARRLVEAGTRFVTVNWPYYYQWDSHGNIDGSIRSIAPPLDSAMSALLEDLKQRGMLDRTLVLCMGEFGRTPKLNKDAGRDHWVSVMSVLAAGAGIRGGQVLGSSTVDGQPDERPVHARDLVATAYTCLGIDLNAELTTLGGRPFNVLPGASPIRELL